jgi:hypothetical protein
MAYSYDTVLIESDPYTSYAEVAEADAYLGASITATDWRAAGSDTKGRAMISAMRWMDSLNWQGERTEEDNAHAWPRSGIDGVDEDTIPDALLAAFYELAAALVTDPELRTTLATKQIRSVSAGSVNITYGVGQSFQVSTPLPKATWELILPWLAGSGYSSAPQAQDVCSESPLKDGYDLNRGW